MCEQEAISFQKSKGIKKNSSQEEKLGCKSGKSWRGAPSAHPDRPKVCWTVWSKTLSHIFLSPLPLFRFSLQIRIIQIHFGWAGCAEAAPQVFLHHNSQDTKINKNCQNLNTSTYASKLKDMSQATHTRVSGGAERVDGCRGMVEFWKRPGDGRGVGPSHMKSLLRAARREGSWWQRRREKKTH